MQSLQPLRRYLWLRKDACGVAARPGQAGDKTKPDRVFADTEDDRDRRRRCLGRERGHVPGRGDHGHPATNEIGHQRRQAIVLGFQQWYSTVTF